MKKIRKFTLISLLVGLFLVVFSLFALNSQFFLDRLEAYLSDVSGYNVEINGGLDIDWFQQGITLSKLRLYPADGFPRIEVESLQFASQSLRNAGLAESPVVVTGIGITVHLDTGTKVDDTEKIGIKFPHQYITFNFNDIVLFSQLDSPLVSARSITGDISSVNGITFGLVGELNGESLDLSAKIYPKEGTAAMLETSLAYQGVLLQASGSIANFALLEGFDLALAAGNENHVGLSVLEDQPFRAQKAIGKIKGDFDNLEMEISEFIADSEHSVIKLSGYLSLEKDSVVSRDLRVDLSTKSMDQFLQEFGVNSSLQGEASLRLSAEGVFENLTINSISVEAGDGALKITGSGSARFQKGDESVQLALSAESKNLPLIFKRQTDMDFINGVGTASAKLLWAKGQLSASDLIANFDNEKGDMSVKGEVKNLYNLTSDNLLLNLQTAPTNEPEAGPIRLDLAIGLEEGIYKPAKIKGEWELENAQVDFEATIEDLLATQGISGSFRFRPLWNKALAFSAEKNKDFGFDGEFSIADMKSKAFSLQGKMTDSSGSYRYSGVFSEEGGQGQLFIENMNPNALAALAGMRTEFAPTMVLETNIKHTTDGFDMSDIKLKLGLSDLQGSVKVKFPNTESKNPLIRIKGTSKKLEFKDFGILEENSSPEYFSSDPMNLPILRDADFSIELQAESVGTKALEYEGLNLNGTSSDGVMSLFADLDLLGGGSAVLEFAANVRSKIPDVRINAIIENINPAELRSLKEASDGYDGDVDIELSLTGKGDSVHDILSTGNGYFLFRVNSASIPNQKLHLLSADFLLELVRRLNPFIKKTDHLELDCALAAFQIIDGMAVSKNSIALQARKLLILGDGSIDLESERLKLVVKPKASEGFGLNTSSLVKFMGVGGTLSEPKARADTKGLLLSGASLGAAVATGGMSLFLQNVFDRITSGAKICERMEDKFRLKLQDVGKPSKSKIKANKKNTLK